MKVKSDHRSKFSNLSKWKEEAWKYQGFNVIRTRDLRDTGAMLDQLSSGATHLERGQLFSLHGKIWTQQIDLAPNVWLHGSVGRSANMNFIYISHELSLSCNFLEPTFLHGLTVWGGNSHLKLSSVKRSTVEIFWNIVRFLAPCLEVLPFWYLFCACAVSLELSSLSV